MPSAGLDGASMRQVDSDDFGRQQGRYARGVLNPDPAVLDSIRKVIAEEPGIAKAALARRLGLSRATVGYYLRHMGKAVRVAAERNAHLRERRTLDYFSLLERVAAAGDEIATVIDSLKQAPLGPQTASTIFKGHLALERNQRLLGELMGAR